MKKLYFNDPQLECMFIGANTSVCVMGRRTGKTHGIAAPYVLRCVTRMPGSTGGIVVPTFLHGLTNTIPGLLAALRSFGYIEGIHFVVGKIPPEFFAEPIIKPSSYQHVISFWNGSVAILLSQDRAYAANSLTLSWILVDEAKFIDREKLHGQTIPANGGSRAWFGNKSSNHAMMILSDMPQTKKGSWFLNYSEKQDPQLISVIKALVHKKYTLSQNPKPDTPRRIRDLDRDLNRLRSVATYYRECSSIENIQLIGEQYIRQMKRDLTPLTFQTSIMCRRIGITNDGFYSCLEEKHYYDASDFDTLDKIWDSRIVSSEEDASFRIDASADADVIPDDPILIGMDYNANINWIVAAQATYSRLNVIKSFYVKYERKIPEVIADFCAYYASHRNKTVVFYYDSTALGQNYFINAKDIRAVVISEFNARGWECIDVFIGKPMRHDEKYRLINYGLAGRCRLTPYFNRQNNNDLILAIQSAGVERGSRGFRKDKSGEKIRESEEDPLELRTDGTDAFDTLYIGAELFPQYSTSVHFSPSVM